jgi:hypothetical protein
LERALGFDLGVELGAKSIERGTVFLGDDGVLGGERVGSGVLRRLALAFFGARSGAELGVAGVRDLAGWRHVEGPFLWNEFRSDFSRRRGELEGWRSVSCGGARRLGRAGAVNVLPGETRQAGDEAPGTIVVTASSDAC